MLIIADAKIVMPNSETSLAEALSCMDYACIHGCYSGQGQVAPACLHAFIVGGDGAMPHNILEKAVNKGGPIHTTYGMTETSSMVTLSDQFFPSGFSGHSLEGNELEIAADGETLVRSLAVCSEHLHGRKLQSVADEGGAHR